MKKILLALALLAYPASAFAFSATAPFTVGTTTSTYLTITNAGNVGIGSTNPSSLLTIQGASPAITLTKSLVGQTWQLRDGGTSKYSSSFDIFDATTNSTGLLLDGSNDVLIGTSTNYTGNNSRLLVWGGEDGANIDVMGDPSVFAGDQATIELEGSDYATNPNSVYLQYHGAGTLGTTLGFPNQRLGALAFSNAATALIYTSNSTPLIFGTNYAERMRIDAAGNVGIGTISPSAKLDVAGSVNIGSNAAPAGITLHDTATKSPYCVRVTKGALALTAGACP